MVMSLKVNSRVLVRPLGVKGTVVRAGRVDGIWIVQADSGGPPLPWNRNELEEADHRLAGREQDHVPGPGLPGRAAAR